ncbi:MAG: hypothetical protein H7Y37_08105 [Anaerolineae bacterium]|nr:hypothetical protein [Gloeobacterales cyanobacterium ES-bin-313]
MIHHLSIAAQNPKHVADVLAELIGGICVPFPPHPGSFFALALDEHGTGIEVYPAGTQMQPAGIEGAKFVQTQNQQGFHPVHVAVSVTLEPEMIQEIARRENWSTFHCDRDGLFEVIEVWIENTTLVELLPPVFAKRYLALGQSEEFLQMLADSDSQTAATQLATSR